MSNFDSNDRRPVSSDAGGNWIVGIIVVVLIGLGLWWWAGTGISATRTADMTAPAPASTTGRAPHSGNPATPPGAPAGTAK